MSPPTLHRRLRDGIVAIALFVLTITTFLALAVLLVWPLWIVGVIALAAAILALPLCFVRRWLIGSRQGWSSGRSFAGFAALSFMLLASIAAFPLYYLAYLVDARPALAPLVTLTDGRKTVHLQGMQHVASEGFYKSVVYDLREALAGGYRLFYEGVQPVNGRPELTAWFNGLATSGAGTDLSAFYGSLADGCGMKFQLDYFQGLLKEFSTHPDRHFTADVTYLDLKTEYDRLIRDDPAFARAESARSKRIKNSADDGAKVFRYFYGLWRQGTPDQKRLLGLACRGYFSLAFSTATAPSHMDKLILDYRNKFLANAIAEAKDDKIWITYGARHLPGVIDDLKTIDLKWHVVAIKWSRTISNPDDHRGELK